MTFNHFLILYYFLRLYLKTVFENISTYFYIFIRFVLSIIFENKALCLIFISNRPFLKSSKTSYCVERALNEISIEYDNLYIIKLCYTTCGNFLNF